MDRCFADIDSNPSKAVLLHHLNSGLARFGQHWKFDKNLEGNLMDLDSICEEVQDEALTGEELWAVIKGFFDHLDFDLLNKALDKHVPEKWCRLYIERWLNCQIRKEDGTLEQRTKGTPQGGVISPLLANLFLHYAFDAWMSKSYPDVCFERYADDIIVHCSHPSRGRTIARSNPPTNGELQAPITS